MYNTTQRRKNPREAKKRADLSLQKATILPGYGALKFTSPFHQAMLCYCLEYLSHSHVPSKILPILVGPDQELPLQCFLNIHSFTGHPFIHSSNKGILPGTGLGAGDRAVDKPLFLSSWSLCFSEEEGEEKLTNIFTIQYLVSGVL